MNLKSASLAATLVLIAAVVGLFRQHALFADRIPAIAVQVLAVGLMI